MELTVGSRWQSAVSTVQVIVVASPGRPSPTLECGGVPVLGHDASGNGTLLAASGIPGPLLGKRYVDEASGLEVLCTRNGAGGLAVDGRPMELKAAKPLPASD